MGDSLKFHHFWLKLFTFLTRSTGRCHLAAQDVVGFALPGWATLAVLLAHHRKELGKRGHPVGAGLGKEEATDELC